MHGNIRAHETDEAATARCACCCPVSEEDPFTLVATPPNEGRLSVAGCRSRARQIPARPFSLLAAQARHTGGQAGEMAKSLPDAPVRFAPGAFSALGWTASRTQAAGAR